MDPSTSENVYYLSPLSKKARIEFKKNEFFVHSHIEDSLEKKIKPIILPMSSMQTLIEILPMFLNTIKTIEFENQVKVDEDSIHSSSELKKNSLLPIDKEYNRVILNTSGIYQAIMTVSTYMLKPYIWLKLHFNVEDRYNPGTMKACICNGGTIFNDVDIIGLTNFVNSKIQ